MSQPKLPLAAVSLLVIFATSSSCKRETLPTSTTPVTRPDSLVATLSLPRGNDFSDIVTRINDVGAPGPIVGVGAASGVISLLGMFTSNPPDLQADQPLHLLLVGKPTGLDNVPAILLASAREGVTVKPANDTLVVSKIGKLTMIAPKANAKTYQDYVGWLISQPLPRQPVVRIYPSAVATTFKDEINKGFEAILSQANNQPKGPADLRKLLDVYRKVGGAMVEQAKWVDIRVGPKEGAFLEIASSPKTKTTFEEFLKLQRPHAFDLSKYVQGESPQFFMEGDVPFGPLYEPMLDWVTEFMPMLGEDYRDAFAKLMKIWDGRMFMVMDMSGFASGLPKFSSYMAAATTKPSASVMDKLWSSFSGKEVEMMGFKQSYEYKKRPPIHGVDVHELITTMRVEKAPEVKQHMVSVSLDKWWLLSQNMGSPTKAPDTLIKSLKGGGGVTSLTQRGQKAATWAKSNKESLLFWADLKSLIPEKLPVSEIRLTFGARNNEAIMGIDVR